MIITSDDRNLIQIAQKFIDPQNVRGGTIKEVGCALVTQNNEIYSGASMHLSCGIGFCAEHTAISQMISQSEGTRIKTIVAVGSMGIMPPCGRCRELMNLLDERNSSTEIIISESKKILLSDLLPCAYRPSGND